jgi:hypothetical protein
MNFYRQKFYVQVYFIADAMKFTNIRKHVANLVMVSALVADNKTVF